MDNRLQMDIDQIRNYINDHNEAKTEMDRQILRLEAITEESTRKITHIEAL
jgi:hypothetical protein